MSNLSIAVYNSDVLEQVRECLVNKSISVDPLKFDYEADALVFRKRASSVLWLRGSDTESFEVFLCVAKALVDQPWLCLRFPEKVVWEYDLYYGCQLIDQFMPLPDLWGKQKLFPGNPTLLTNIWGGKASRISNYLVQWQASNRGEKAYWSDRFRFGNSEQGFDFLRRLTGIQIPQ